MSKSKRFPSLILGTAMWGWNVSAIEAHRVLDTFYEKGFRQIDAATNYPINKVPNDFRRSEQILEDWIRMNGVHDLKIMMKVGSLNNLRSPEHNLSPSFLQLNWLYYLGHFGSNLDAFLIHWDNRDKLSEIEESFAVLQKIHESGLKVGASGIRFPDLYAQANRSLNLPLHIQVKHHLLHSDIVRYSALQDHASFYTYGINAGGLKLHTSAYKKASTLQARGGKIDQVPEVMAALKKEIAQFNQQSNAPLIKKMNEVAMSFALLNSEVAGVLIGPSRQEQLLDSLAFYQQLQDYDYAVFYQGLLNLHKTYAPSDRSI
jgi:aryl-alcohol dehydrogenase-like predicted oxidoreductase